MCVLCTIVKKHRYLKAREKSLAVEKKNATVDFLQFYFLMSKKNVEQTTKVIPTVEQEIILQKREIIDRKK